jgi:hypothetical protein
VSASAISRCGAISCGSLGRVIDDVGDVEPLVSLMLYFSGKGDGNEFSVEVAMVSDGSSLRVEVHFTRSEDM